MKISLSSVALIISLNRSDRRRRRGARTVFAAPANAADQVYQNKSPANPTRPSRRRYPLAPSSPSLLLPLISRDEYFFIRLFHFATSPARLQNGLSDQNASPINAFEKTLDTSLAYSSRVSIKKSPSVKIYIGCCDGCFLPVADFFTSGCRRQNWIKKNAV